MLNRDVDCLLPIVQNLVEPPFNKTRYLLLARSNHTLDVLLGTLDLFLDPRLDRHELYVSEVVFEKFMMVMLVMMLQ